MEVEIEKPIEKDQVNIEKEKGKKIWDYLDLIIISIFSRRKLK